MTDCEGSAALTWRWTLNVACPTCTGAFEARQVSHSLLHVLQSDSAASRKGSCSTSLPRSHSCLRLRSFSVVQAELLAFTSDKERAQKKMFDLYRCAVWKVKCDSNMSGGRGGSVAKAANKLQQDGDRRSFSCKRYCAFLASWSPNPARISSLIKQHVSQCSKDYYEWHFTSKMPTDRQ